MQSISFLSDDLVGIDAVINVILNSSCRKAEQEPQANQKRKESNVNEIQTRSELDSFQRPVCGLPHNLNANVQRLYLAKLDVCKYNNVNENQT